MDNVWEYPTQHTTYINYVLVDLFDDPALSSVT